MSARQRGATIVLALLLLGRCIDVLDLPFERRIVSEPLPLAAPPVLPTPVALPAPAATPADSGVATPSAAPLPINTATLQELQTLPGVGPVLAQRILDFRSTHGALSGPQDLRRIKGIGARGAERLAPLVRFE
jgi:competence protein ComEA